MRGPSMFTYVPPSCTPLSCNSFAHSSKIERSPSLTGSPKATWAPIPSPKKVCSARRLVRSKNWSGRTMSRGAYCS